MKKILSILILLALVISTLLLPVAAETKETVYSDVSETDWYYDGAVSAKGYDLMHGIGEDTFAPKKNVTREEFVTVIARLAKAVNRSWYTGEDAEEPPFSDYKKDTWYSAAVEWTYSAGITKGTSKNTFGLGQYITREEIATVIARFADVAKDYVTLAESDAPAPQFKDAAKISSWAKNAVDTVRLCGIFEGDNGYFNPQKYATRAEVAEAVVRLYEAFEVKLDAYLDADKVSAVAIAGLSDKLYEYRFTSEEAAELLSCFANAAYTSQTPASDTDDTAVLIQVFYKDSASYTVFTVTPDAITLNNFKTLTASKDYFYKYYNHFGFYS